MQEHDRNKARQYVFYALFFVMGAAVATLVFSISSNTPYSSDTVSGSAIPGSSFRGWETIATRTFSFEGGEATARTMTARTSSGRNLVWAEVELESLGQVELSLDFPKESLRLVSFSREESGGEAVMTAGGLRLIHSGKDNYKIMLERRGQRTPDLRIGVTGSNVVETLPTASGHSS
jgi:hypothetical protein